MSGADKLKEKILAEAEAQAGQVLAEARERAAQIVAKSEKEAAARKQAALEAAQAQSEERLRRALTIAELDARKAVLAAKEEMIEETFRQALSRLQSLDDAAYREVVFPMLLASVQFGIEKIIVSPRDRARFSDDFLGKVNEALVAEGKKGELALAAETREMQGGFVLRAGDVEINNSFDSILRMQRDQLEPDVAAILFS